MKAVLFDFDGVVANTMRFHVEAWVRAFKDQGMTLDESLVYINEGSPSQEFVQTALQSCQREKDDPIGGVLLALKDNYMSEMDLTQRIYPLFPTVLAAAKALTLKTAIVTGSSRSTLSCMLPAELAREFDCIVTGDDTRRGKPSPDPYLTAAVLLKVSPGECCVIENGPFGIQSAKSAGMRCVAICTTLDRHHLTQADMTVVSHCELLDSFSDLVLHK